MTIAWWQILLLTCLAFWVIIDQLSVSILNNPLAIGMVSGIIMGDITTGLAVLAVPVGLLMVQLDVLARFINTFFQHRMDKFIKENNPDAAARNALWGTTTNTNNTESEEYENDEGEYEN